MVVASDTTGPPVPTDLIGVEDDAAPRWGVHWSQILLALIFIGAIVALVLHARDAKADQEREAQVVAQIDADAESVIVAQNRSINLYDAVDSWLAGTGTLEPAGVLRMQLDEQLASTNAAGSVTKDLVGDEYLATLVALEAQLDRLPEPDPSAVDGVIEPFERQAVGLSRTYESLLSPERRAEAVGDTSNEERGMRLLLVVTLSGLLLGLVTTLRSRNAYRRSKARIDADRIELARASVLERGEADVLAGIVTDQPIGELVVEVLDLAHRLTGGCLRFRRADDFEVAGLTAIVQRTDSLECPVDHLGDGTAEDPRVPAGEWEVTCGGVLLGSLQLCPGGPDWQEGDRTDRVARRCADLIALVIDRALAGEQLMFRATHDVLTGMPNREQAIATIAAGLDDRQDPSEVAVVVCDLDRFKVVNESLGHRRGDELLQAVARRLAATVEGTGASAARLGGDEFAVTCCGAGAASLAETIAQDLVAGLEHRFVVEGDEVYVTASLGIAVADTATDSAEALLGNADVAMRAAKRDPDLRVARWEVGLESGLAEQLATDAAFRGALVDGGLLVHLQPVVDVDDDRAVGVEALVRWNRDGTLAYPDSFLPAARAAGLMGDLGRVVVTESLQALAARWGELSDVTMWLNTARVQFRDRTFPEWLATELQRWGVPATSLVLEVSETDLLDVDEISEVIAELRAMGVRLAMDDFGTGYSSLVRLSELPVDIVKLDRAFVAALATGGQRAHDVLRAAVDLVLAVDLELVVEGVETKDELDAVRDLGCRLVQGYLLRRPGPADEVLAEISDGSPFVNGSDTIASSAASSSPAFSARS